MENKIDESDDHSVDEGISPEFDNEMELDDDDVSSVELSHSSTSSSLQNYRTKTTVQDASLQSPSPRTKQRRFVSNRLGNLKELGSNVYTEIMVEPILQYFVANLCDLKVPENQRKRIGLRYSRTPEVQRLIRRLRKSKTSRSEIANADPNVIIAVLRQLLADFPGGIFDDQDEEFLCVSLHSRLDLALDFVNGLVQELPIFLRQFTYLVCKSLRNLAQQSAGNLIDSYTDLLMLFTPVLFPNSVGDVSRFLRASRITLILVDMSDDVFLPFLQHSSLTDSAYHSDEDFFADVLNTLNQLSDSFHVSNQSDSNDDEFWLDLEDETTRTNAVGPNNEYYQITYM
ncbi:hypothetical protein M3Y94_00598700 [Aphelenchoides besseyi]|nr:hypothetical protein M3Y94_00598700 [Aphelenchoides besseyi]KAI6222199.1 Rho GTPase-activating protein domain and Rho GTPase activation protein domain-containing protein [Aphelenchoides besseyi]